MPYRRECLTNAGAALVTGSDSGIGRAVAITLARAGFDVGVTWHTDHAGAQSTAAKVRNAGRRAVVERLDLQDVPTITALVDNMVRELGGLSVLVNNGAVNHRAPFLHEQFDDWNSVIAVNLTGQFMCAQAVARHMVTEGICGRIVNITSVHEHVPLDRGSAYCAAKAALGSLTRVMALELACHHITVNAVAPGHIATPMNGYRAAEPVSVARKGIPVGRVGRTWEVAGIVRALCSEEAAYTTGTSIVVDGGLMLMSAIPLQTENELPADDSRLAVDKWG